MKLRVLSAGLSLLLAGIGPPFIDVKAVVPSATIQMQAPLSEANVLTNQLLESIRIIDQKDADQVNRVTTNSAILLYPIANVRQKLHNLESS